MAFPRLGEPAQVPALEAGWPCRRPGARPEDGAAGPSPVSVVTPCLDPGPRLEDALDSVAHQGRPPCEHIVIDGGSRDGTPDVLARRGSGVIWISEPDRGQADAVNKGLARARGEIVGWLNADDLYLPDTLAEVAGYLAANPDVDVVYGDCYYLYEDRTPREVRLVRSGPFDLDLLLNVGCPIPQPATFWRRRVHAHGLLDADLRFAMDYEYWLRLARAGARFAYLPRPLACFRVTAGSKSGAALELFWPEVRRASRRHGGRRLNLMLLDHLKGRLRRRWPGLYAAGKRLVGRGER